MGFLSFLTPRNIIIALVTLLIVGLSVKIYILNNKVNSLTIDKVNLQSEVVKLTNNLKVAEDSLSSCQNNLSEIDKYFKLTYNIDLESGQIKDRLSELFKAKRLNKCKCSSGNQVNSKPTEGVSKNEDEIDKSIISSINDIIKLYNGVRNDSTGNNMPTIKN